MQVAGPSSLGTARGWTTMGSSSRPRVTCAAPDGRPGRALPRDPGNPVVVFSFGERYSASYENSGAGVDADLPVEPAGPPAPARAHGCRAAHHRGPRAPARRAGAHRLPG